METFIILNISTSVNISTSINENIHYSGHMKGLQNVHGNELKDVLILMQKALNE